ncbi:Era-like GTP-binding protein [Methanocella arvoryzae]|uniref:Conserved GTP-binding protein (Ras family) n=1 Tax=Methanocella arvoryzae (strain DSM 22066 / NBRC 105507 / MRE50) TaxID=351160 RepID=Q0W3K2_METAR|nr:conserved GTP-binding protein (Ras family) [Methanocella arvoryzae MRE50]
MSIFTSIKGSLAKVKSLFARRKMARIGIYGPPNAGKTTLANRIVSDFTGEEMGSASAIPHETRRVKKREGVTIKAGGASITLDVIDTPGLATRIDFHDFMAMGIPEEEARRRAKEATEGVIEAIKWMDNLDGVLLVMDSKEDPYTQVNVTVVGNMEARHLPMLIVANKMDLDGASVERIKGAFPQHTVVPVSALKGTNIELLYETIAHRFG